MSGEQPHRRHENPAKIWLMQSRGALYSHVEDKRALFRAVFHAVEVEISARTIPEPPPQNAADADLIIPVRVSLSLPGELG